MNAVARSLALLLALLAAAGVARPIAAGTPPLPLWLPGVVLLFTLLSAARPRTALLILCGLLPLASMVRPERATGHNALI